jgi:hypothetical protein
VQFGHPGSGGVAHYRLALLNRFQADTPVDLSGRSLQNWPIAVDPTHVVVHPSVPVSVTADVTVPVSPSMPIDVERVSAWGGGGPVVTTTSYLITIAMRHAYNDLPEGHWADDPVQYLSSLGVISGYGDGSFRPNTNVTRAQFAKMLVGALGWEVQTPANPSFSDVAPDFWAYGFIETAAAHGVISGYSDGTFRPAATVTRAQLAKMVSVALGWTMQVPAPVNFTDVAEGDWVYNYAMMVSSAEVMSGYSDNTFRPNAPATRAQIAKILTLSLFSDPNQ